MESKGVTILKIVGISDTHNQHEKVQIPECDILIHAGDYSFKGYDHEIRAFYKWLNKQPAKHKISISGNHELGFESDPKRGTEIALQECPDVKLLNHESITVEGIKIFGSPWTPYFCNWAYNAGRTIEEAAYYQKPFIGDLWKDIPEDVDIVVSHGPVYGILDELCKIDGTPKGQFVGCVELLKVIQKVKPKVHIAGHIHAAYGQVHKEGVSYYNVCICNESYYPSNPITEIDYVK